MFRISILVYMSLLFYGNTAKPYKLLGKVTDVAAQETWMSDEFDEKMPLDSKAIEAPEDQGTTDDDIDTSMLIWKAMIKARKQKLTEKGKDKYQEDPTVQQLADLPVDSLQLLGLERKVADQPILAKEPDYQDEGNMKQALNRKYSSPEEDLDDLYHADILVHLPLEDLEEMAPQPFKGVHTEPEEDLDGLYHAN